MGVAYDAIGSPLVTESEQGIWKAGRRCPDVVLQSAEQTEPQRLYSTVRYGKFLVISLGGPLQNSWSEFQDKVKPYCIVPTGQSLSGAVKSGAPTFECEQVKPDEKLVVVVRPDMYIGYVGTEEDSKSFLSKSLRG